MYKPTLKYLCVITNARSLWPQVSMIKYLNSFGVTPYLINQLPKVLNTLNGSGVNLDLVNSVPNDCDVLLSQSAGQDPFEINCLEAGHCLGKVNVKVHNSISTYNTLVNINYTTQRVNGRLDAICFRDQRSIDHFKLFLGGVKFFNVGDPDWDFFKTNEFKNQVFKTKEQYGDRVLSICASFETGKSEIDFWSLVISWAEKKGFKVLIRPHPGYGERFVPEQLKKHLVLDNRLHRHVLLASSSHVIAEPAGTIIAECHLLETRVGSYPFIPHHEKYGHHTFIDNYKLWNDAIRGHIGNDLLSHLPLVHTTGTLYDFLASTDPLITDAEADSIWGWPKNIESYSSNLFEKLEQWYFGRK